MVQSTVLAASVSKSSSSSSPSSIDTSTLKLQKHGNGNDKEMLRYHHHRKRHVTSKSVWKEHLRQVCLRKARAHRIRTSASTKTPDLLSTCTSTSTSSRCWNNAVRNWVEEEMRVQGIRIQNNPYLIRDNNDDNNDNNSSRSRSSSDLDMDVDENDAIVEEHSDRMDDMEVEGQQQHHGNDNNYSEYLTEEELDELLQQLEEEIYQEDERHVEEIMELALQEQLDLEAQIAEYEAYTEQQQQSLHDV